MIVYRLLQGPRRYSELLREIPGISERMLTTQLKQLSVDGVVARMEAVEKRVARTRQGPPYCLTEAGERLRPVFDAMFEWGTMQAEAPSETVRTR